MAKAKRLAREKAKKVGGPYLAAAIFCETILEDSKDKSLSAIRIIDTVIVNLPPNAPPDVPSEKQRLPIPFWALLSFKTGGSPGRHTLRIDAHSPSGKSQTVLEQVLTFPEEAHAGANVRLNSVIQIKKGGLFWLHVFLDDRRMARMPLMISVQRAEVPTQAAADKADQ
jgi:hypothetical protein